MILSASVAAGRGGEIGQGGTLPWPKLPDDIRYFRLVTRDAGVVLMGRRTWETLPAQPLPHRLNIVLSRRWPGFEGYDRRIGCHIYRSDTDNWAERIGSRYEEIVIIGGRTLYELFWPRLDRLYLTAVAGDFSAADVVMPELVPLLESPREPGPYRAGGLDWYKQAELVYDHARPYPLRFLAFDRGALVGHNDTQVSGA
jgi:dihydrofolate reductase